MWGKVIGGMAGFAFGGPLGAVVGAALGHAADSGGLAQLGGQLGNSFHGAMRFSGLRAPNPARMAALLGQKDQLFAICVIVLAAKLAKSDGAVNRAEIDAFKRSFRIPPEAARDVARLFDSARDSPEGYESYADELGQAFADNPGVLEDVLATLFAIARADQPITVGEQRFLQGVAHRLGLGSAAWERAARGEQRRSWNAQTQAAEDPYAVLGVPRSASADAIHAAWRALMRENHPDSLASRGVPPDFVARAHAKVARINAAWDVIKRERGL